MDHVRLRHLENWRLRTILEDVERAGDAFKAQEVVAVGGDVDLRGGRGGRRERERERERERIYIYVTDKAMCREASIRPQKNKESSEQSRRVTSRSNNLAQPSTNRQSIERSHAPVFEFLTHSLTLSIKISFVFFLFPFSTPSPSLPAARMNE